MASLRLAPGAALPLEAVTETFAILGRRGSGKTYTASVLTEEMLAAGLNVAVLDPLDVWWGLRSSADGLLDGFPVVVFGGSHADVPLEAAAGRLLADVIIEDRISAILSVRHLSKTEQRRFVGDFAERIYERKGHEKHREPLHLVIDEADAFVPQRLQPGGEHAYGAIDTLVRRGRSSGVGTTLISQRAAVIAKDVLTQTEVLVCHQTTGPQDRRALEAWVEANDDEGRLVEFMDSLASLKRGEAWLWSPSWLKVFKRVQVRSRRTFDSSSTPTVGQKRSGPKARAAIDLEALGVRVKALIEQAKADDPKALRARIAELEKQKGAAAVTVTVPMFDREAFENLSREIADGIALALNNSRGALNAYMSICLQSGQAKRGSLIGAPLPASAAATRTPTTRAPAPPRGRSGAGLGKCARLLLTALLGNERRRAQRDGKTANAGAHPGIE